MSDTRKAQRTTIAETCQMMHYFLLDIRELRDELQKLEGALHHMEACRRLLKKLMNDRDRWKGMARDRWKEMAHNRPNLLQRLTEFHTEVETLRSLPEIKNKLAHAEQLAEALKSAVHTQRDLLNLPEISEALAQWEEVQK